VAGSAEGSAESQAAYHFSLGQSYALEGSAEKAIEEYKLALVYDPSSAVIHTRLATEYVKRGLLTFAIEECKTALIHDAKYSDARLLLAGLYGATKLVDEALKEYDSVLKLDPLNAETHKEVLVFKASLLIEEGRAKDAIPALRQLLKLDPDSYLGHYYWGRALAKQGDVTGAAASFKKSMELKRAFSQAALALGALYEEKNRQLDAIRTYEEYFADVRDEQVAARLAQLHLERNEYRKALRYLQFLDRLEEDNLNVKVKIGLIHVELKEYRKAAATFEDILARNNEAERVRFYLGSVYEELKDYSKAIEVFRKVSPESSAYPDASVHVGYLYKLQGDTKRALEWMDKAISQNGDVPGYYTFKATLVEETAGPAAAITVLEAASEKFPRDEKLLYYLGSLYDKTGATDKALKAMGAILEANPDNANALNYIGYTLASRDERLDAAENMVRRALEIRPEDGYIQDSLGYVLYKKGRTKDAIITLEKAYRTKPGEGIIAEHLGDAYARHNLRSKALQKYLEASKLYSDPAEKSKVEKKIDELQGAGKRRVPAAQE
jgi:tetratricopeptide (TPR) repeat protein